MVVVVHKDDDPVEPRYRRHPLDALPESDFMRPVYGAFLESTTLLLNVRQFMKEILEAYGREAVPALGARFDAAS